MDAPEIESPPRAPIPSFIEPEIPDAERRVRAAGAKGGLSYAGAGAFGIVFVDEAGRAWKAARIKAATPDHLKKAREWMGAEYEWMKDAEKSGIAPFVAKAFAFHPEQMVLEKEYIGGKPGGWGDGAHLKSVHVKIDRAMEELGWTAPEFKEDSYIIQPDGTTKLVDTTLVQRTGMNLARWAKDVLDGKRTTTDRWSDIAFYVLRERPLKTIPDETIKDLVERLNVHDPSIKENFIVPWDPRSGKGKRIPVKGGETPIPDVGALCAGAFCPDVLLEAARKAMK